MATPGIGWTPVGDPTITDTTVLLEFSQGGQTLSVDAITDSGVPTVSIGVFPIESHTLYGEPHPEVVRSRLNRATPLGLTGDAATYTLNTCMTSSP